VGSLTFYNSSGQVITGGSITDAPIAAYVEASTNDHRSGDTKATLYAYTPKLGEVPATWSGNLLSRSTNYPNASAPAPLNTATEPVVTGFATDTTLASYISQFPNTDVSNDGYAGLYELRVQVSGPGIGQQQGVYWNTVISVDVTSGTISDPTAGTWSVDWPPPSGPAIQAALHGTSKVGSVDSCVPTGTTGATKVTYAWQENGKAISGATAATYKIPPALLGEADLLDHGHVRLGDVGRVEQGGHGRARRGTGSDDQAGGQGSAQTGQGREGDGRQVVASCHQSDLPMVRGEPKGPWGDEVLPYGAQVGQGQAHPLRGDRVGDRLRQGHLRHAGGEDHLSP
jgi:hypothetical protein